MKRSANPEQPVNSRMVERRHIKRAEEGVMHA